MNTIRRLFMKKINYLKIILFMMLLFCTFSVSVKAAESRKNLGYKWSSKYSMVYFYFGLKDTWKNAISSGMYTFTAGAASNKYDMQTVATHELGHAIGVAHCHEVNETSCFSATCPSNVMMCVIYDNSMRRKLTDYDTSSKQLIYCYW
jgi:Matrixin.